MSASRPFAGTLRTWTRPAKYGKSSAGGNGTYTDAEVTIHIDLKMKKAVIMGALNGELVEGMGDVEGDLEEKKISFSLKSLAGDNNAEFVGGQLNGMRTTMPEEGNKWYKGKNSFPRNSKGGNCTWYAYGRFCEIAGKWIEMSKMGNAVTFYDSFPTCETGQTPKVGAIACWGYGSKTGHPGHVAVVEEVKPNGDIYTSNSGWSSSSPFYMQTFEAANNYSWSAGGRGKAYFRGFIYQP